MGADVYARELLDAVDVGIAMRLATCWTRRSRLMRPDVWVLNAGLLTFLWVTER